ncbi:hypothetical protein OG588_19010 [Streptomyces prunicolor]|uniref:hypothetical protein n=1 Tax=Streptomyces prunicolor TaxID=67348 RepID=UPI00386DF508|nr:hypothetical protein OG588_19010 [Streptomyces prunicolor]
MAEITASSSTPPCTTVDGWLASAHPSPSTVWSEWSNAGKLALIPLGHSFEAVRIPEEVVHAVVRSDEPTIVSTQLAQRAGGPVIHDPWFHRYYALVPPGTSQAWTARAADCLGEGTYLGVPRTDRTDPGEHTQASYWSVPMTQPGALCMAADLLELVILGGCLTDGEDES